ncbi:MAG: AMP-binding protein [Ilumatobacteraceae bacterium]
MNPAVTGVAASIDAAKAAMMAGRDVPWLLRHATERSPDKAFLVWEPFTGAPRTWSYAAFRADVRSLAAGLHGLGVRPGDRVMVHLDNSPEFLLSWFACAELGAVAVSTNTRSVARDLTFFAEHARVVGAITSPAFADLINESAPGLGFLVVTATDAGEPTSDAHGAPSIPFDEVVAEGGEPPGRPVDPMADLGIQFTSGTTSRPKAVLWTHANAIWGAQLNVAHMRLRADDITLTFLPLFHTNAQSYSMLSTLWSGGTIVVQPRFSASRFWDVAVRNRVTWCSTIPFCIKAALAAGVPDEHHFRFWGTAARLCAVEDAVGIATIGWWGMTETITHGIVGNLDDPGPDMSIGRASPGYDIAVRRPDGTPIAPGERGDLFIRGVRGVSMFKEYADNPAANAEAFDDDGWFATGDLVEMDLEGNLFFRDRAKDMLKVGAENVAASEIEAVINETGLVSESAVVGQSHAMLDEVPVAFVIPADPAADRDELAARIVAVCADQLADFKVPRTVHVVDDLPRSTLEKIAKNELRARLPTIDA